MVDGEERLVQLLGDAKAPVWVAGMGTMDASAELRILVRLYPRLKVVATPRAKGIFSEFHERYLGTTGLCSKTEVEDFIEHGSDLLVLSGSRFGETSGGDWKRKRLNVPVVRIDAAVGKLRRHPSTELEIEGEIRSLLRRMVALRSAELGSLEINTKTGGAQRLYEEKLAEAAAINQELEDEVRKLKKKLGRLHPLEATLALQRAVPAEVPIYCDIGNTMCWLIRYLKRLLPRTWHVNLVLGSMGYAIPAAAGGALALRRPVVATVGDAAFLMSCGELATLARLRLPVVVVCFSNGTHGTVDLGCKKLFPGSPIPEMLLEPRLDVVSVARGMGIEGRRFESVSGLEECLASALACGMPYVIDLAIDPEVEAPIGQRVAAIAQQVGGILHTTK